MFASQVFIRSPTRCSVTTTLPYKCTTSNKTPFAPFYNLYKTKNRNAEDIHLSEGKSEDSWYTDPLNFFD